MKCSDVVGWDGSKCVADSAVCSYQVCLGQLGGELDVEMPLKWQIGRKDGWML